MTKITPFLISRKCGSSDPVLYNHNRRLKYKECDPLREGRSWRGRKRHASCLHIEEPRVHVYRQQHFS